MAAAVPRCEPALYLEKDFSQQIRPQPLQRPLPDGPVGWLSLGVCQFEIPGQDWPILVPRIWQTRRAQPWQRSEITCCDLTSFSAKFCKNLVFLYIFLRASKNSCSTHLTDSSSTTLAAICRFSANSTELDRQLIPFKITVSRLHEQCCSQTTLTSFWLFFDLS